MTYFYVFCGKSERESGTSTTGTGKEKRRTLRTESKLYPECGARLKNFHSSSTVFCICPSLFETNVNKAKYSIYEKLSTVLSVAGIQFSAAPKALVFGNLF